MTYNISTLKKAMMGIRRYKEHAAPMLSNAYQFSEQFQNTFERHLRQAIAMADFNKWTLEDISLYTRSKKYVSTVSKFLDKNAGYTYLFIRTPKSTELITLELVHKDMLELTETNPDIYLKLLKILH